MKMSLRRNLTILAVAAWAIAAPAATVTAAPPDQPAELSVGQPAPDFDLTLFSGEKVSLKSFRGHSVVINFWRSG